jgi:hypothetical protein
MNYLHKAEIRTLMQAAINAQVTQERLEILQTLETLQSCYRGSDPGSPGDSDFPD